MQFTHEQRLALQAAKIIELTNQNGMKITLTNLGASWMSCILPLASGQRDVILGSPNIAQQMQQTVYLGATVVVLPTESRTHNFRLMVKIIKCLVIKECIVYMGGR